MRNAPSILLAIALAAPTFAEEFDVLFDQPQLDRWMYPFNSSAGARATMSVFGSDREVPTQFDARDGQILLAFDTDLVIPPGGTAAGYRVTSAEVTMQVQNNLVFRYDPTPDAWTTFLPATDARRTVDADAGQPVELFGVGFRGGYSAATFGEDTAFTGTGNFLSPGVRNAFAAVVDATGMPSDVSNNPRVGFQPKNFATGSITGLAPGALVPADSVMRFTYSPGALKIEGAGQKIADLPAGTPNNHWARNIVAIGAARKFFIQFFFAKNFTFFNRKYFLQYICRVFCIARPA
jgi:hypothetical protein